MRWVLGVGGVGGADRGEGGGVQVTSARGPVLFRTEAAFGAEGDLARGPAFEVVREPGGAVATTR